MRNKLGILLLVVIFLVSMVSYSAPPEGKGKPPKPDDPPDAAEALYQVSIAINEGGAGIATGTCAKGYFYATGSKGKYLLQLESDGTEGPIYEGEPAPLTMDVITGLENPITLEGCEFWDGCHGNPEGENTQFPDDFNNVYDHGYEGIFIRFLKSQDGFGPEADIQMRWFLDFVPGPKKHGVGWHIYNRYMLTVSTNLFDPSMLDVVGSTYETNIIGPFYLLHDGIGLGDYDPTNNRVEMPDFDIKLTITRIQ